MQIKSRQAKSGKKRFWTLFIALLFFAPLVFSYGVYSITEAHSLQWWQARTDSTGMAPDPRSTTEAIVQVYAARAFSWRGVFGVHTWFAVKPSNARSYTRYEVFGWGVRRGRPALLVRSDVAPDGYWFGSQPELLVDLRGGAEIDRIIQHIDEAARAYPHMHEYRLWPGPNSNTFTAFVARQVPELRLDLPPTAIGKDYIAGGGLVATSPSGTGAQLSVFGLAGLMVGLEEGIEVNLLGLTVGIDLLRPALKLPGLGRVGMRP
ncbi:MAG: DUF3750 domain-containing protein [Candidatus Competibacteraceae bacterium]|nr:DUF3750 domain-containing protein [Candidatus Competibacteraceae bacterium]MCB1808956.1 DUF3750 domain-containing protein [Candidatus Competibacteraceae bacterium]MCB1814199.1 DUF3750 domain-containing protein [Candidatus Competibacteraceae bacterium]